MNPLLNSFQGIVSAFADDLKFLVKTDDMSYKVTMADIVVLRAWSLSNRMSDIQHCGKNNPVRSYSCGNSQLPTVNEESDFGVTRTNDAVCRLHLYRLARKAAKVVGVILSSFRVMIHQIFDRPFKLLCYLVISYASPVWNPARRVDIDLLEKVQRKSTKRLLHLKDMSCDEHLKFLSANSLECIRKFADLVLMYKCIHELINITPNQTGLSLYVDSSRGGGPRLISRRSSLSF